MFDYQTVFPGALCFDTEGLLSQVATVLEQESSEDTLKRHWVTASLFDNLQQEMSARVTKVIQAL